MLSLYFGGGDTYLEHLEDQERRRIYRAFAHRQYRYHVGAIPMQHNCVGILTQSWLT